VPAPAHPRKREFYVYQFEVKGYPFYVGIGRDRRDSDRIRYVRSLLTPKNRSKLKHSSLNVRVMAQFIHEKQEPNLWNATLENCHGTSNRRALHSVGLVDICRTFPAVTLAFTTSRFRRRLAHDSMAQAWIRMSPCACFLARN
jgi:hypothetical protein